MTREKAIQFLLDNTIESMTKQAKGYVIYRQQAIELVCLVYDSLQYIIEPQEIIIKDKSNIMEVMAQPNTCDGCMFENAKYVNMCDECLRNDKNKDHYEPKVQP
jgi:hypothetical protein